MDVLLPAKVRAAIYVIVVIGTAILVPLNVANIVSDVLISVWMSVSAAASGLAAFNVNKKIEEK
jgi:hypothetical protein